MSPGDTSHPSASDDTDAYRRFVERLELRHFFYRHGTDGVFTYLSPSITNVLGYSPPEFEKHYTSYLTDHPINSEVVRRTDLSIQGIQQPPYFVEIKHKDGSIRMLEVSEYPVRAASGEVVAVEGIAQDVTAMKRVEEALRESNSRLNALVESSPHAILSLDPRGKLLSWNRAAERIFGWSEKEVIGRDLPIIPPGKEEEFFTLLRRILNGELVQRVERSRVRKDGSLVEIAISAAPLRDEIGGIVGLIANTEDITEAKRLREGHRESEERFRTIFEHLNDAAFLTDVETGIILDANRAASRLLGIPSVAIIGMHFAELHPPEDEKMYCELFANNAGRDHGSASAEIVRLDGARVPVEISSSTMMLEGRRAILGLFRDITDRCRSEEERERLLELERKARGEAEAAVKARDEFLNIAAHDLKTPLGALQVQIEGMRRADERERLTPEIVRQGLKLADRQCARLVRLVKRLLELTRIGAGRLELRRHPCDLAALAREVCERHAPILSKAGCAFEFAGAGEASGEWDGDRLEQVIENLLSNAIKFGAGKPVSVSVSSSPAGARLAVTDHGIGIATDQRERIFEPFERGASAAHHGGLGMGLYISRKIVEAHDGTIAVESSPGRGSTLRVELPPASKR